MKRQLKTALLLVPVLTLVAIGFVWQSRPRTEELFRAAGAGDTAEVNQLLERGANPNAYGDKEFAPLYIAAMQGKDASVRALLAHGADVNIRSRKYSMTPLAGAAMRGRASTIKILLSKGADPNLADKFGHTPLGRILSIQRLPSQKRSPDPKFSEAARLLRQAGGGEGK